MNENEAPWISTCTSKTGCKGSPRSSPSCPGPIASLNRLFSVFASCLLEGYLRSVYRFHNVFTTIGISYGDQF